MNKGTRVWLGISLVLNAMLGFGFGMVLSMYNHKKVETKPVVSQGSTAAVMTVSQVGVMSQTTDGFIFAYSQYQGHPVQLVSEDGRLMLRVEVGDILDMNKVDDDATLAYLKTEVEHLVKARTVTLENCYTFEFTGNWPLWEPYQLYLGKEGRFACINFSDHGTFDFANRTIKARGERNRPTGYYPYAL